MFFHCRLRTHVTFQLLRNNIVAVRKGTGNEIFPENSCRWQLQSFSSNETFSRWRMREQVKLRFEFPHSKQQMEQTFFYTFIYFPLYEMRYNFLDIHWSSLETRRGNVHTDSNGYPSRMSFSVWRQTCWNCRPQFSMSQSVGVCLFHFRHITRSSVHWSGGALSLMCTRSPTSVESFEKRPMFLRRTLYNTFSSWKSFQISTAT